MSDSTALVNDDDVPFGEDDYRRYAEQEVLKSYELPTLQNAFTRLWNVPPGNLQTKLIRPEGTGKNGLFFLGEAGGKNEQEDLLPFRPHAAAGSVLERCLRENGIDRQDCLISNTVWWQPRNNATPNSQERFFCRHLNQALIDHHKPRVLVALGATAFHELTGIDPSVQKDRGYLYKALPEYGSLPVILTYHPSFLARGSGKDRDEETNAKTGQAQGGSMALLWVLKRDIRYAFSMARLGVPTAHEVHSIYNPRERECEEYFQRAILDPALPISYDFENGYSLILSGDEDAYEEVDYSYLTQMQISIDKDTALIWDWSDQAEKWLRKFMLLPNLKIDVNGRNFDRRYLRRMQVQVNGQMCDLCSLWHHWQPDLPKNLQFVSSFFTSERGPWKHLMGRGDNLTYGQEDSIRPIICYYAIRDLLTKFSRHPVSERSLLEGYEDQVLRVELGSLDAMERRGIPVNAEKQLALSVKLTQMALEIQTDMQQHVPESVIPQKQKEGLAGFPMEWRQQINEAIKLAKDNRRAAKLYLTAQKKLKIADLRGPIGDVDRISAEITRLEEIKQAGPPGNEWTLSDEAKYVKRNCFLKEENRAEERWVRLETFNPNSSLQMLNYIEHKVKEELDAIAAEYAGTGRSVPQYRLEQCKWKVPIDRDTHKPTTSKLEIGKLRRKTNDPLLKACSEFREVTKLKGAYVGSLDENGQLKKTKWSPGEDGLVHPYYYTGPATGQLAARDPAALTYPKHNKKFFQEVRGIIQAPPGRCIVEADWKAFHCLTTGFEAGCPTYMRLARLDMHSFFAATKLLKLYSPEELLRETDDNLKRCLKELRKSDRLFYGSMTFQQVRDKRAKPSVLGYGFGLQAGTLYNNNEESFDSLDQAKETILELDALFPIPATWKRLIVQEADEKHYLLSRYGYIRWFNCVFNKRMARPGEWIKPGTQYRDTKWGRIIYTHGDDHEACVAFRPANDAFGMARDVYNVLEEDGRAEKWWLSIPLHDALVLFPRIEDRDECAWGVKQLMEAPSPWLRSELVPDGLWCEAEVMVSKEGGTWAEMEEVKF